MFWEGCADGCCICLPLISSALQPAFTPSALAKEQTSTLPNSRASTPLDLLSPLARICCCWPHFHLKPCPFVSYVTLMLSRLYCVSGYLCSASFAVFSYLFIHSFIDTTSQSITCVMPDVRIPEGLFSKVSPFIIPKVFNIIYPGTSRFIYLA